MQQKIDFLHLWLGDSNKNHCECEECRKRIPSDFYVMFLNELWDEMKKRGCKNIKLMVLVAAPEGIACITSRHPDVDIYAGALDDNLNENGYIVPGLGDAGDRIFGTK